MSLNLSLFMFSLMLSIFLMFLNYWISKSIKIRNKFTPFECGFDSFSKSRLPFSMQFFIISLIFLICDVEIMIFFPFFPSMFLNNQFINIILMMIFILILILRLYIELFNEALNWLF